jgi:hypothetical protein
MSEKIENLIISRIRNSPGAKFRDIFDLEVKAVCSKISNCAHDNLFRVVDRYLQSLRREGRINYRKGGWFLT